MRGLTAGLVLLTFALPLGAQAPPPPAPLPALGWSVGRTLGLWWTRQHDPNVSETEIYHAVWLREAEAPDSAVFDFLPYLTPPREADGIALAYDAGLGGRMWSGVRDDNLVEGTLAAMGSRVALELWRRVAPPRTEDPEVLQREGGPRLLLRFGGEAPHAFASDGRDVEPLTRMAIAYADLDLPLRGLWQLTVGTRGYLYRVPGEPDDHDLSMILRLNRLPPTPGISVLSEWSWTSVWQRVWVQVERPFDYRGVQVRPVLRFCAGRDLPFALGFWPGGPDGFPGLDYGEGRGDREVTLGLHLSRHLGGRFTAHFSGAAGTTALGGPLLPETGWVAGVRAGLGIDTRLIGTLRVEPGVTSDGRASVFLRVANWL
jgi:hypothetical protein